MTVNLLPKKFHKVGYNAYQQSIVRYEYRFYHVGILFCEMTWPYDQDMALDTTFLRHACI